MVSYVLLMNRKYKYDIIKGEMVILIIISLTVILVCLCVKLYIDTEQMSSNKQSKEKGIEISIKFDNYLE